MTRTRWRIVVLGVAACAALAVFAVYALTRHTVYDVAGRVVILDAGHFETPEDTGALAFVSGTVLAERDVNWEVTLLTMRLLQAEGIEVVLTRKPGEYIERPERYRIAEESGGEVLVSIHHNATDDASINYSTTFYTHQADISIARRAQEQLAEFLGFQDGDIRPDTFGITTHTPMPAALTEAWFITHTDTAERYLAEHQQRGTSVPGLGWQTGSLVELEARAISAAIVDWLQSHPPPE